MEVYKEALSDSKVVVLSGGLPQGVPACCYKALIEEAKNFNIPVILDSGGDALKEGIKAKPNVIKPNLRELGSLIQKELRDMDEIVEALKEINADGIDISMVSMGDKELFCARKICALE